MEIRIFLLKDRMNLELGLEEIQISLREYRSIWRGHQAIKKRERAGHSQEAPGAHLFTDAGAVIMIYGL